MSYIETFTAFLRQVYIALPIVQYLFYSSATVTISCDRYDTCGLFLSELLYLLTEISHFIAPF